MQIFVYLFFNLKINEIAEKIHMSESFGFTKIKICGTNQWFCIFMQNFNQKINLLIKYSKIYCNFGKYWYNISCLF